MGPIFEADLLGNQYGFRPAMDAKMAIRKTFWHITARGRSEVVDADLSDYLDTASYYPQGHAVGLNSCGWRSNALIRSPFCLPRTICTASSSPRLTRCNTV